jgi:hypothetical protein
MKLFDDCARSYRGPKNHNESAFIYLNRTARPSFEKVRVVLEDWFSRYPASERSDLRSHFRDDGDTNHNSAFFELFLHELFFRQGCKILVHPKLAHTATRPDFLVEFPNGNRIYVEAVVVTSHSAKSAAADARLRSLYEHLDRLIDSKDFFIGIDFNDEPSKPPSAKQIANALNGWIRNLDADDIIARTANGSLLLPRFSYESEDWSVNFVAIPKKPEARNKLGVRPLGMFGCSAGWSQDSGIFHDCVRGKAGKYGQLNLPFMIAVKCLAEFPRLK